jgi:hypothetical protein
MSQFSASNYIFVGKRLNLLEIADTGDQGKNRATKYSAKKKGGGAERWRVELLASF